MWLYGDPGSGKSYGAELIEHHYRGQTTRASFSASGQITNLGGLERVVIFDDLDLAN